ncbi:MAG: flagellar biosynthetic protein FliR [Synergistaceae bacterium]|jgi:flagellar biosynthetic protein FliR|nr:flagellar biosynthetic protein FliR [Synergistaceae bacterium]
MPQVLPLAGDQALVSLMVIYFMVSVRFLALIFTASVFMLPSFPNQAKLWVSVMLSVIVTPLADVSIPTALLGDWVYVLLMTAREFLIGASIGFISSLPLYALQASGYVEGMVMGFNMMNMFDPLSSQQSSVLAQVKYFLAIWFFMRWNGHILLVRALAESLTLVPPGPGAWPGAGGVPWLDWLQRLFLMAMSLSLPVLGAVILADVGLGFVARTVPQMNVFVLGIPLKICVGFLVLLAIIPSAVDVMHAEVERAVEYALSGIYYWR